MTASDEPKRRMKHPERVTMTPECVERIDHWNEQLSPQLCGKRLSRSDFINWLIRSHAPDLGSSELSALHSLFFDPVKALEWAARQAKEAKARGEAINIQQFVDATVLKRSPRQKKEHRPRQRRRDNSDATAQNITSREREE